MKIAKSAIVAAAFLSIGSLAGCMSFFPSKPAQRAADKVLDEIMLGRETASQETGKPEPRKS